MTEYINKSEVNGLLKLGWSGDAIVTAITNGGISSVPAIPIPEGATNGDMIKIMFPYIEIEGIGGEIKCIAAQIGFGTSYFALDWWNAPYKKGREK